jgi:hypothetical protein
LISQVVSITAITAKALTGFAVGSCKGEVSDCAALRLKGKLSRESLIHAEALIDDTAGEFRLLNKGFVPANLTSLPPEVARL